MAKSSKRTSVSIAAAATPDDENRAIQVKRTRKTMPRDSPQQRSSVYRGVTRHRWTGRYEAHLWDKNCWSQSQKKKGRQVYLGAYDDEEAAAHAYDLAALKYWGHDATLNFSATSYESELKEMEGQSREEYVGSLRRKSSGFARGVSKYRGVARHHHNGRWEARIGRVFGNKYLYLGTYATQEEAAMAYDVAAIEYRGVNAVTNFDINHYMNWIKDSGDPSPAGLLLHTSKLKEILSDQTMAMLRSSPSTSSEPDPEPPRRCFPADIQTSFDFQDSSSLADEHDVIFGNYDSFVPTIFPCELDT